MNIKTLRLLELIRSAQSDAQKRLEAEHSLLPKDKSGDVISEAITDWIDEEFTGETKDGKALRALSASLLLLFESEHPPQNWEEITQRVAISTHEDEPGLAFWQFGCLVTSSKADVANNWPSVKIVDAKTRSSRLEQTKGRTKELNSVLTGLGIRPQWYVPIVDTDINLLYANVLGDRENSFTESLSTARNYIQRLQTNFAKSIGGNMFVGPWSQYEDSLRTEYEEARRKALPLIHKEVPGEVLQQSLERRCKYFQDLGLRVDTKLEELAFAQMTDQISGYAAEGELLLRHLRPFSMLVIADNDAERFVQYHSVLTGSSLPIWMPYGNDK